MKKCVLVGIIMSLAVTFHSYAGEWKQDGGRYWWQNEDGSYPAGSWEWLDGNGDGTAECYYFEKDGYLVTDAVIDGSEVNAEGAWVIDRIVQTRSAKQEKAADEKWVCDTYIVGDKIIRGDSDNYGNFSIVMNNLDGSGKKKLLDVYTTSGYQVVYGEYAYLVAQQMVSDQVVSDIYRVSGSGTVKLIYRSPVSVFYIGCIGDKIYFRDAEGWKCFSPDDIIIKPSDRDDISMTTNHGQDYKGVYTSKNYTLSGNTLITKKEDGTEIRRAQIIYPEDRKMNARYGNDKYTIFNHSALIKSGGLVLGSNEYFYIFPAEGGEGRFLCSNTTFLTYGGEIYNLEDGKRLYRLNDDGNMDFLFETDNKMNGYGFEGDYFVYRFMYDTYAVKLHNN